MIICKDLIIFSEKSRIEGKIEGKVSGLAKMFSSDKIDCREKVNHFTEEEVKEEMGKKMVFGYHPFLEYTKASFLVDGTRYFINKRVIAR